MKLFVIRHGESEADILNVIEGRADFNLTDQGVKQAKLLAKKLKSYNIEKIYSSPLKRARQTAELLGQEINKEVIFLDDLMEFNNGLIAGLKREVADKLYPKDINLPFNQSMYGMESLEAFRLRAEKVLNYLVTTNEAEVIAIVAHGGIINRLYQSFMKMPLETNLNFPTGDTGFHLWEINNNERTVLVTNDLSHLDENEKGL